MKLDAVRDYLTMPEIAGRWRASDPDMCRAILKGLLRPSLYINARLTRATVSPSGEIEGLAEAETVTGWHYVCGIQQVGALDCTVQAVSVVQETMQGAALWILDQSLRMSDLLAQSVVMAEDLLVAEAALETDTCWQQRSARTKEFKSVLNVLSIVLADAYRYDPRVRSSIAREITEAGNQHGIAVSAGTVSKWIQEASEQFTPSFMDEPVRDTRPQREAA